VCGIGLILGPRAADAGQQFAGMLAALAPRGESLETHRDPVLLAGTQRLRIVDRDASVQPWTSADGRWVLCYNGELFNYL
jgi:asparagine synthase (glutamine-hydrolysing)